MGFHPSIDDILFDYLMIFVLRSGSGQETNQILSNFIYSSDAFPMNSLFASIVSRHNCVATIIRYCPRPAAALNCHTSPAQPGNFILRLFVFA